MWGLFKDKPPELDLPMFMHENNINQLVKYCENLNIGPNDLNELLDLTGKIERSINTDMSRWQCRVIDNKKYFTLNREFIDDAYSRAIAANNQWY